MLVDAEERKPNSPIEAISSWAIRTRKSLLADAQIPKKPLLVEFDGMGGAGKGRTIGDLGSHYFQGLGIQWLTFPETNQQISNVSKEDHKAYWEAQWEKACENLQFALNSVVHSAVQVALFDRGIFDFIALNNLLFTYDIHRSTYGDITEEECCAAMERVFAVGAGKIDLLFVYVDSIDNSLRGKMMPNSLAFVNSMKLKKSTPKETYMRFELAQKIYRQLMLEDARVAKSVKMVVEVDIEKSKKSFDEVFERVVATICLYLVFKAWESSLLTRFGENLNDPKTEKQIIKFATMLDAHLTHLREKMTRREPEIPVGSNIATVLEEYHKRPLVIAQSGNVRVIAEKIFGSPPQYRVKKL